MAEKKILDVTSPVDTKVEIGSKPMIVGHKSMVSDPMVREAEIENKELPVATVAIEEVSKSDPVIAPPSERQKTIEPINDKPATVESKTEENPSSDNKDNSSPDDEENENSTEIDPAAVALEQEEVIRKLLESKKYRVSIKQARNTGKSPVWIAIAMLLVGLITLFVLVDTKKLDIGFDLPFSVFSDDNEPVVTTDQVVTSNENTQIVQQPVSASWLKYENDYFSIRIPDGWQLINSADSLYASNYELMQYKVSEQAIIINEELSNETNCCFFVDYSADSTALTDYQDTSLGYTSTPILLDTNVQSILYNRTLTSEKNGLAVGTKISDYVVLKDSGSSVVIRFISLPDTQFSIDQLELSVKTLVIK